MLEYIILICIFAAIYEVLLLLQILYETVNNFTSVIIKNWHLITLYFIVALLASPITILKLFITSLQDSWETRLRSSIKNNFKN